MKSTFFDLVIDRKRSMMLILFGILVFGVVARLSIPTEGELRVELPYFVISIVHEGISPEDALRLLVKPLEIELKTLEGVKEITGSGAENVGIVAVEFQTGIDLDVALTDVREAVSRAKPELPIDSEEPIVTESASTDFPLLQVNLVSEFAPERLVFNHAREIRDQIETLADVHSAVLQGHRDEFLEISIEPARLIANGISVEHLIASLARNNQLIPAGSLDTHQGSVALKIPSVVEEAEDLLGLPVFSDGDVVVTLGDVASIQRTFKDRSAYARANGQQSISVFVYRRTGANSIRTAAAIREILDAYQGSLPKNIEVFISRDVTTFDENQITELEGNIVTALFLVLAVVLPSVGFRSSLLVTLSIPVSFLFALIILWLADFTFNFMVMFGMLMSLGMLIDGAIIVTEDAERRIALGTGGEAAYGQAARRMFTPVVASMATTLAAFLPLMFWPGAAGAYMAYLPIAVIAVLLGSLLYTLLFIPSLGSALASRVQAREVQEEETDPWLIQLDKLKGLSRWYTKLVSISAKHAIVTLVVIVLVVYGIFALYGSRDLGVIFFNENDPPLLMVYVRGSGNLDVEEASELVREVESAILEIPGLSAVSTHIASNTQVVEGQRQPFRGGSSSNVIGTITIDLLEANERTWTGVEIVEEIRSRVSQVSPLTVEVRAFEGYLTPGKPIFIQFTSRDRELLKPAVEEVRSFMETSVQGLRNIEDTLPVQGFEWQLEVDRAAAALHGADVTAVGLLMQLLTDGAKLGEYRPNDADTSLDIRVRLEEQSRGIEQLDELYLTTSQGPVPTSNFVVRTPVARQDALQRRDQRAMHVIQADVLAGVLVDTKVREIQEWLDQQSFDSQIDIRFRATTEDQEESIDFVSKAFSFALLLMFVLLVTQFNSIYQSFITIFAVVLATAGVFLGLVITSQPFSAILSGVGIIALAGIIVNNSIVLIDTYNIGRREHPEIAVIELITKTGLQRLRPVLLTTVTTMIGLLPLASHQSIDFINRVWTSGSTLSNYWVPLAQAIAFGLSFATVLTLIVTPALLHLPESLRQLGLGRATRLLPRVVTRLRGLPSEP